MEALEERLRETEAALHERQIKIEKAGSIAETSLILNGVFEAAQASCSQYVDNIRMLCHRQEQICARIEQETRENAEQLLEETKTICIRMKTYTEKRCHQMIQDARAEVSAYWNAFEKRLNEYYNSHPGLRETLFAMQAKEKETDQL